MPRLHSWEVRRKDSWSSFDVNERKQSRIRSVRQNLRKATEGIVPNLHFASADVMWLGFGGSKLAWEHERRGGSSSSSSRKR